MAFLKALVSPFSEIQFCPTGGITQNNVCNGSIFLSIFYVGGSWIAPK
ncbi:hypothetical protein [Bartonella phoceensis]|nr:hypothetical protein [Bartonella phoceensis]